MTGLNLIDRGVAVAVNLLALMGVFSGQNCYAVFKLRQESCALNLLTYF